VRTEFSYEYWSVDGVNAAQTVALGLVHKTVPLPMGIIA
jgi:hypothetical protein